MIRLATALLALAAFGASALAATPAELERRAKAFYELLERGERERAAAAFPDLERELAATAAALREDLDRMREEVAERDGDLQDLYRSPRWRQPEVGQMVVGYHLAWVRYQGALLGGGERARREQLLRQAAEGFSQFLLLGEVPEIYAESLYGRGLAFMELGETAKAREDLGAAAAESRTAGKARAALAELARRTGGRPEPAPDDPETLASRLGELLPRAAGGDQAAEKDAASLARGLAARGGPWPARIRHLVADRLGTGTPASVRSSWGLALLAQLAIDQNRCADVAPLVEAGAALADAGRARHRPELLFVDAGCRLNLGQARAAAERFAALLGEFPDAGRAREAAYYRFRALAVARGTDGTLDAQYAEALATYLARFAGAEGAAEAHFLFAELHRSRGDCARATTEYARVPAGPFAARARLGVLQCRVAGLPAKGPERAEVLAALRAFAQAPPVRPDDAPQAAHAALLGAAVAASSAPPDHAAVLELLEDFESRWPAVADLHRRARVLRLRARVGAGQAAAAATDLDAVLSAPLDDDVRRALDTIGRELATQAEQAGSARAATALGIARRVYAALVAGGGSPADRIMLADLELRAGDAAAARRRYEEVLAAESGSAEARRGAARAAAAAGDRAGALAHWRDVVESSPAGGTAWYEARLAQVELLADSGLLAQACDLVRQSRGRATSAGGDALDARLRAREAAVCR